MAITSSWKPTTSPTAAAPRGNFAQAGGQRDLDGFNGVGTYGANFTDDGEGGMILELNSSVARNGKFAGAYPLRQLPEFFGLTSESFTEVLTKIIEQIVEDHGDLQEDGSISVNFQPVDKTQNINYVDRFNYCVALAPGSYLVVAGFFEPNEPEATLTDFRSALNQNQNSRPRDQYMIKLAQKSRLSEAKPKRITTTTVMNLRNGKTMPLEIIVDKQEGAVRGRLVGFQLSRMNRDAPAATTATETQ